MKPDTERKKYHKEKLHRRRKRMHVHLSKDLRSKLKVKKRAILVHKGDLVRILRGPGKGSSAKISSVNTVKRKVHVEGVTSATAKGRETPIPLEPSNLVLLSLEPTKERKKLFSEAAFKKEAPKKKEPPKPEEAKKAAKKEEKNKEKNKEKTVEKGKQPENKKKQPETKKPMASKPNTQHQNAQHQKSNIPHSPPNTQSSTQNPHSTNQHTESKIKPSATVSEIPKK